MCPEGGYGMLWELYQLERPLHMGAYLQLYVVIEFLAGGCKGFRGTKFKIPQLVLHPGSWRRERFSINILYLNWSWEIALFFGLWGPEPPKFLFLKLLVNQIIKEQKILPTHSCQKVRKSAHILDTMDSGWTVNCTLRVPTRARQACYAPELPQAGFLCKVSLRWQMTECPAYCPLDICAELLFRSKGPNSLLRFKRCAVFG